MKSKICIREVYSNSANSNSLKLNHLNAWSQMKAVGCTTHPHPSWPEGMWPERMLSLETADRKISVLLCALPVWGLTTPLQAEAWDMALTLTLTLTSAGGPYSHSIPHTFCFPNLHPGRPNPFPWSCPFCHEAYLVWMEHDPGGIPSSLRMQKY